MECPSSRAKNGALTKEPFAFSIHSFDELFFFGRERDFPFNRIVRAEGKVCFGRFHCFSVNLSARELMQYRFPVGVGPSSKTCPKCPPHFAQTTSILFIP